mgnify:CR=1 FL=1
MRSKLRNECMRFLRFSYLVDFIAMNSLKEIYLHSVEELKMQLEVKLKNEEIVVVKESGKDSKEFIDPIFEVDLTPNFVDM